MVRSVSCFLFYCIFSSISIASDVKDVCLALANQGFVDTRNTSLSVQTFVADFDYVCSRSETRRERYQSRGGSFKAKYKFFGASGGVSNVESESEEAISATCELSRSSFQESVEFQERTSSGSTLAAQIVDCAKILRDSREENLFGRVEVMDDDESFIVSVEYIASENSNRIYTLKNLSGSNSVNCFTDNSYSQSAFGNWIITPRSSKSFVCTKPPRQRVQGRFNFVAEQAAGGEHSRGVPVDARSVDMEREIENRVSAQMRDIERRLSDAVDARIKKIAAVPVLVEGSHMGQESVFERTITISESGYLIASGYSEGIRNSPGNTGNAGVYFDIAVGGQYCARDMAFEGESQTINFYASATCQVPLRPGTHTLRFYRTDHGGNTQVGMARFSWLVVRAAPD